MEEWKDRGAWLQWFSRFHMLGLAEWEDETRQDGMKALCRQLTFSPCSLGDGGWLRLSEMRDMKFPVTP